MKATIHVPVNEQNQDQLEEIVKRLFPGSQPVVTQRASGTSNIDWQRLGPLSDLLGAEITYSPYISFTLEGIANFSKEQEHFLNQPGIEANREISPDELSGVLE